MKAKIILLTSVFFLSLISISHAQTSFNFSQGLNAAKTSGKKVFIDIYSEADNWSKKMESEVYTSPGVQKALSAFVFVKLNADGSDKFNYGKKDYSSSELAKYFGATGYPAFVILNSDGSIIKFKYNGEEVTNLSGFIGEEDFIEMLEFFSQNKFKDSDLSTVFQN